MQSVQTSRELELYLQERPDRKKEQKKIAQSRAQFLSALPSDQPHLKKRLEILMDHFLPIYARADILAEYYQNYYKKASKAIYFLAATAVIIIAGQYIFHLNHWIGTGEIIAIGIILAIISVGNRIGWHRRWVDYRFLAERLRYGILMAFLTDGTRKPANEKGLQCYTPGKDWANRYYLLIWNTRAEVPALQPDDLPLLTELFRKNWLEDQCSYHQKKNDSQLELHKKISRMGELFFRFTLAAALLHLLPNILHLIHVDIAFLHHETINRTLTFCAIAFPSVATACSGIRAHFDYKKIADRSAMMNKSLTCYLAELETVATLDDLARLAGKVEFMMARENSDWCVTIGVHTLEPG